MNIILSKNNKILIIIFQDSLNSNFKYFFYLFIIFIIISFD